MVLDLLKNGLDPSKLAGDPTGLAGDPAELAGDLEGLAEPLAAFLNPETGQATAVKPDPAGWPKAEVSPAPPFGDGVGEGAPDLLAKALEQAPGDAAAAPDLPGAGSAEDLKGLIPGLEAPAQAPGAQPVQLSNPETGALTKIAPDDAGWPKADVTEGLPKGLSEGLPKGPPEGLPGDLPNKPELPGADLLAGKAPEAPKIDLPGATPEAPAGLPKQTQITGLETGDVTTIAPDSAGWPKASVQPGGLPELPDGLPKEMPKAPDLKDPGGEIKPPDLLEQLKDQL